MDQPVGPRPTYQGPVVVVDRRGPLEVRALDLTRWLSYLMDRCFELPGTRVRFGLNSLLLLLLPGLGNVLAPMLGAYILAIAFNNYRVPRIVAARMVVNTLLDGTLSALPIVGLFWNVWFKADTRNVRLLEQYVSPGAEPPPATWRHWAYVIGVLTLCVALLALIVVGAVILIQATIRGLRAG
jgi:hypothetical protein